jgi:hypothetical protein
MKRERGEEEAEEELTNPATTASTQIEDDDSAEVDGSHLGLNKEGQLEIESGGIGQEFGVEEDLCGEEFEGKTKMTCGGKRRVQCPICLKVGNGIIFV